MSTTVLFCIFTAVGRVCLGQEAASAPRYAIFFIPAFYSVYILLNLVIKSSLYRKVLFGGLILLLTKKEILINQNLPITLAFYKEIKITWKQCYLKKKSIEDCNESTGMVVVMEAPFTEESLKIMEESKMHFFK